MRFRVALKIFQNLLQKALPAIPPKSTLPVLEHLLFQLNGNTLRLTATDQDITIITSTEVNGEEDGSILVPGRKLDMLIKALNTTSELYFTADMSTFEVFFKVGKGNFKIMGLDPDEYLNIPELFSAPRPEIDPSAELPTTGENAVSFFKKEEMIKLANTTVFATSKDEYRPAMTGVYFQLRGDYANAVATDSFRLVKCTVRNDKNFCLPDTNVIIPHRTAELLAKIDDDVLMTLIDTRGNLSHVRYDIGNMILVTRIVSEKFPPYESVLEAESKTSEIIFEQKEMLTSLKRVSLFANANTRQIRLNLENESIHLFAEDDETGNIGEDEIKAEYIGEPVSIGFNCKFLEEAIEHSNPDNEQNLTLKLYFGEPNKPVLLKQNNDKENLVMLMMPMKLSTPTNENN